MTTLLETDALSVVYPGQDTPALRDICLSISAGESVGILGPSGCGKSTLAWSLLQLHPPAVRQTGEVRFDGRSLQHKEERQLQSIRGREISLLSQEPASALHPLLRIEDQIFEVLRAHFGLDRAACAGRIEDALALAGLPASERILRSYPHQLSSGERQRAALAQAMVCHPRLLIADEPTSALDASLEQEFVQSLRRWRRRRGAALLFITHNPALLEQVADRVVVLCEGQIVESGPVKHVFTAPRHDFTRKMLHHFYHRNSEIAASTPGKVLVRAQGLTRIYSSKPGLLRRRREVAALKNVDFAIREGEVVALVGPSGSGKSTLGRCLAGIEQPTSGLVEREGIDRFAVQYVYPDGLLAMNPDHTVARIIGEPARLRCYSTPGLATGEWMNLAGLPPSLATRRPGELSGGQRQRVLIARALASRPRVLILDESLSALDLPVQWQLVSLLLEQRRQSGLALLFILHDMKLAEAIAGRIVCLRNGRLIDEPLARAS